MAGEVSSCARKRERRRGERHIVYGRLQRNKARVRRRRRRRNKNPHAAL